MSLRKIDARFIAHEDTTGDVRTVEVFGHVLTTTYTKIEVDDVEFGKLHANPHIEIKGSPLDRDGDGKAGGSRPRAAADVAPAPEAEAPAAE